MIATLIRNPKRKTKTSDLTVARITEIRAQAAVALPGKIIVVMSPKGGQGKSSLAKELAWDLDAPLVDLDWDGGRVSRLLGYLVQRYKTSALLEAIEKVERVPRLYRSNLRPDMVPGHPDFEANQPSADAVADMLVSWAEYWKRPVVVDTHPGGCPSTLGAAAAADLVIMPVILGTGELDAVEEALEELSSFPLLIVHNMATARPPAAESLRLHTMAERHGVQIAESSVRLHGWMRTRKVRTVVSAAPEFFARTEPLAIDMVTLAQEVLIRAA